MNDIINLTFVVPYPDLEQCVKRIYEQHPLRNELRQTCIVRTAETIAQEMPVNNCDVFVARGYTALKMREAYPHTPVIEILITGYDVIRALDECKRLYQPHKVAFIGVYSAIQDVRALSDILCCELCAYGPETTQSIDRMISQAVQDGCDAIVGGYSVHLRAMQRGLHCVLIKTGDEALSQALNEAVRMVGVMRLEREKAEMFQTITHCVKDGVFYVSSSGHIRVVNPAAKQMFPRKADTMQGNLLLTTFPFMTDSVSEVFEKGKGISNELHTEADMTISIDYIPVRVDHKITGVVVSFQNITKIQQVESQIRKKLHAKGLNAKYHFEDIIHKSALLDKTIETAQKFAKVSSNILIVGETGTGKELMAQSIHNASNRSEGAFVAVNCAALPENLLESELFGYVEGAFTGTAKGGKIGLFELAHNGTLFLDEISEIPITFQGKFLRVLQEREVRRVGDDKVISIDVRIIAATNRNLKQLVDEGKFRRDLLYRLDILKLFIPPLRSRAEDTCVLFLHFLDGYRIKFGYPATSVTPQAMELLRNYTFSGNVRELKNIAERVCVLADSPELTATDIETALHPDDVEEMPTRNDQQLYKLPSGADEKSLIERILAETNYNKSETARRMGIDRTTLWRKLDKYAIRT